MHLYKQLLVVVALLALGGCAGIQEDETAGWSAEEIYQEAKSAIGNSNYEQALNLFSKLEARYPYGRYAQQAQLETIYAHYKADQPDAAIAAADRFIKMHPRHQSVDYAYYMRGLASFDAGDGLFARLLPQEPSQRDPKLAREAFRYFQELITRFPKSQYRSDAVKRMAYLRNNLARYEVQVAEYYLGRGAYLAASKRAEYVLENYQQTPAVPDALAIMVRSYRKMEMPKLADDTLRILKLNHPDHPLSKEATTEVN